ncbi:TlpA family protein disulfide reductase [Hyphomonas pacifica]|uniref:Uncharacterized protein n=1 Tax=Hyphomonas pacifica TaxID=1280941 RepID=A0A062U3S8_9PROT|nr:TlpA disulfide reductase family protein [Hyphomonas pacifica]KCZ52403.1 hypothetical protein HY2_08285 [Hyphomonas pacifica]RAN35176.1 hypothetical protein HY3_08890 [Hyphomonas pacifica]
MKRAFYAAASLLLIAACNPAETADPQHGVSTDPNPATRFITMNAPPPNTAIVNEGDNVARDADGRPYGYDLLGQPLPPLSGQMADGSTFDPDMLDTWTVIDVWGIWCGDCLADAPYVAALVTAIEQDPDLDFLSIHTPANANRATVEEMFGKYGSVANYFADKGYSYPTLIDDDASIREALKISWTPSYLLVDPDGIIRGFRSDLSVAGGEPVKDFLKDVAKLKEDLRESEIENPLQQASIGPEGAARLTGAVPFNTDAIRGAFPGYQIVPDQISAEGENYPVFNIMAEGKETPVYVVESSWSLGQVYRVTTRHPDVTGPLGEHIGSFRLSELPELARKGCTEGANAYADKLLCSETDGEALFQRVFNKPESEEDNPVLIQMSWLPGTGVPSE